MMINFSQIFRSTYEVLRCPKRQPKCYDMTEQERQEAIVRLNRNVWNEAELSQQDQYRK